MKITIDEHSGFCFGVVTAIKKAEAELQNGDKLYCLGDIVHNGKEVSRLEALGLQTINHEEFARLQNAKVLLRAHGEPPSTYEIAKKNNITLIDATCPVVLQLQKKIKAEYDAVGEKSQIVIFGKKGHAEVNGLVGQTNNSAVIIENKNDLSLLKYDKDISLFSQTTKSLEEFNEIVKKIQSSQTNNSFKYHDTICRQVANRIPNIRAFAKENDVVLFVSGKKSSNGKILFEEARKVNANTYMISSPEELDLSWITPETQTIGICGATSTPKWLMEQVADVLTKNNKML